VVDLILAEVHADVEWETQLKDIFSVLDRRRLGLVRRRG
jgi:hypothetical protein